MDEKGYIILYNERGETIGMTKNWQIPPDVADYIVFNKGDTVYAKNGRSGKVEFEDTDAAAVLQSVHDTLQNGGLIFIKSGRYELSQPIVIKNSHITLIGETINTYQGNSGGTHLRGNFNDAVIKIDATENKVESLYIDKLFIYNPSGKGIQVVTASPYYVDDSVFGDIRVSKTGDWAFYLEDVRSGYFKRLQAVDVAKGIYIGSGASGKTHQNHVEAMYVSVNTANSVDFKVYDATMLHVGSAWLGTTSSDAKTGTSAIEIDSAHNIYFDFVDIEQVENTIKLMVTKSGSSVRKVVIRGGYIGNVTRFIYADPNSTAYYFNEFSNIVANGDGNGKAIDVPEMPLNRLNVIRNAKFQGFDWMIRAEKHGFVFENVMFNDKGNFTNYAHTINQTKTVEIGTSDSYGPSADFPVPRGYLISRPIVKIEVSGISSETITVKISALYEDGTSSYIEKSFTADTTYYMTDEDWINLIQHGKMIELLFFNAKTDASSTSATVSATVANV